MAVGPSGRAGEVVWVSFTDFLLDAAGNELSSTIKAVRCHPTLTVCTNPILVSDSDQRTRFSDVTAGPDGRTYLSWVEFTALPGTGQAMVLKLRVAPPGSTRFGPTRIVATEPKPMVGVLHANSYVNGAVTIPKNDVKLVGGHLRVFVVWEGCRARPFGVVCEEPRINLARSADFGASWRRTVLSVGGDNYYPTISEDPGGPGLAVAWYTNRHDQLFHNRLDPFAVGCIVLGMHSRAIITDRSTAHQPAVDRGEQFTPGAVETWIGPNSIEHAADRLSGRRGVSEQAYERVGLQVEKLLQLPDRRGVRCPAALLPLPYGRWRAVDGPRHGALGKTGVFAGLAQGASEGLALGASAVHRSSMPDGLVGSPENPNHCKEDLVRDKDLLHTRGGGEEVRLQEDP